MKYKILFKDFIKTFSDKQKKDVEEFKKVVKLHAQGLSRKEILEKIKVSRDKFYQWRNTNIKPIPVKILEKAEKRGYFRVFQERDLENLAYLVGFNLGDGNISRNLCNTWFYGVSSDLEKMRDIFHRFKVEPVIYTYKIDNGKMAIHDHVFSRFLVSLGAAIGDKTNISFKVPDWILNSGKASQIKRKFLQGFFDSELSELKIERSRPSSYKSLKLYSCKQKNFIKDGINFLNQIRTILREFDIISSKVKIDREYKRSRDGSSMQQLFFSIYSNCINLYQFANNIGFLYNSKRRNSLDKEFNKIKNHSINEIKKIKQYDKVLQLRKKGISAYKIAKLLDIRVYHVKNWIYFNRKPRLYRLKKFNIV